MRDYTGRELVKLSEVKVGDKLEVGNGVRNYEPGTYKVVSNVWGDYCIENNDVRYNLIQWPYEPTEDGDRYLSGVYSAPQPKEVPATPATLSEDEMKAFFERMVSTIVGYSKQAGDLKALADKVATLDTALTQMSDRVVGLEADKRNLQAEVNQLTHVVSAKDYEITRIRGDLDQANQSVTDLTNDRDALKADLAMAKSEINEIGVENANYANKVHDRDEEINRLKDQLRLVMEDRDAASKLYSDTRDELSEANRKLSGVQAAMASVNEAFGSHIRAVS